MSEEDPALERAKKHVKRVRVLLPPDDLRGCERAARVQKLYEREKRRELKSR